MTSNMFGLEDEPALVVGGGSGIGRAAAHALAQAGARVVVADIEVDRAETVAAEIGGHSVGGDVTTEAGARAVVGAAHEMLGGLSRLINVVGVASWGDLLSVSAEAWDEDLRNNLTHHLLVGREAARHMLQSGGGAMAFVSSVSGLYGAPGHGAYGAAKAGLDGLVRTMANEWSEGGIRVNAVAPDCIATPRVVAGFAERGVSDLDAIAVADGVPMQRWGTPDEIAGPLLFLVSDLSSFMTGQCIVVDGGTRVRFPHGGPKPFESE